MAKVHRLQPVARAECGAEPLAGELVPLPFIDLDTVIMSMEMLREFPDQEVLDNFNRAAPSDTSL